MAVPAPTGPPLNASLARPRPRQTLQAPGASSGTALPLASSSSNSLLAGALLARHSPPAPLQPLRPLRLLILRHRVLAYRVQPRPRAQPHALPSSATLPPPPPPHRPAAPSLLRGARIVRVTPAGAVAAAPATTKATGATGATAAQRAAALHTYSLGPGEALAERNFQNHFGLN
ncbi:hypothetical protein CHLRE_04g229776v5 [Chlamydomonas reinhardtii]|uniref:Uncharacterized protein n=1 Tax=Chlamydomonas reinhardtii TaxID=3055 RepID=A0A2K3DUV6_CHLRE|nr:uncharacterized protein CHLRE_04g229776v5 [Chlamydomonas reinhardtii]PNW84331.1 hypothetical protein CHLRE_04g229776v5 [Chlamydomonas reinhardtii]